MTDDKLRIATMERAVRVLYDSVDWEADFFDAQHPVEDWAIDALIAAVDGRISRAVYLLTKYERDVDWTAEHYHETDCECHKRG